MWFFKDLRETCQDIITDVREGFIESRMIRTVVILAASGFLLWAASFALVVPFGFAFNSPSFVLSIIGSVFLAGCFACMFASLAIDEVRFNKTMKRRYPN